MFFGQHSQEEVAEVCVFGLWCCAVSLEDYLDVLISCILCCDVCLLNFCFLEGAYDLRL